MKKLVLALAFILGINANSAFSDVIFDIGGGQTFEFQQNSGIFNIPVYIGTDASDSFTGVEFFFEGSASGVVPGAVDGDIIGAVSQAGMVGNSAVASAVVERFSGGFGRVAANYSSAVSAPATTDPSSVMLIGLACGGIALSRRRRS